MNWDYVAGFFDGEGSVYLNRQRNGYLRGAISMYQGTPEVLYKIQRFLVANGIRAHVSARTHRKRPEVHYSLVISTVRGFLPFAENVLPRCYVKQDGLARLYWFVRNRHFSQRCYRPEITPKVRAEAVALRRSGLGRREVATRFSVAPATIDKWMQQTRSTSDA